MRRKDRELTEQAEILRLLARCDTVRLGLWDGTRPYVVPVSFGLAPDALQPLLYFHCAKQGYKLDCLLQSRSVCIEADIFYKVEPWRMGITARYESVVGFGTVVETSGEEKEFGLRTILAHYGFASHPLAQCRGLSHANVYKVILHQLTGKRNLPKDC